MMYPYMILADETEVVHSHMIEGIGTQCVEVHFERPTEDGFNMARCSLPTYTWIKRDGFTDEEIEKLKSNFTVNQQVFLLEKLMERNYSNNKSSLWFI